MRCPLCKSELEERPHSFTCPQCGFVLWREIAGKRLTTAEMEELVTNGRTSVLHGFRDKQGKEFMASLVVSVDNKKVILEFPKREVNGSKRKRDVPDVLVQKVRVETYKSGTVRLTLEGPVQFSGSVSFGVVPARFAECHGLIAAAKLIKHHLQDLSRVHLQISANSRAFVEYVLKEKIPAHLEDRSLMEHLWQVLGEYRTWQIACEPRKSVLLKGGTSPVGFPRGLFPWLDAEVVETDEKMGRRAPRRQLGGVRVGGNLSAVCRDRRAQKEYNGVSYHTRAAW